MTYEEMFEEVKNNFLTRDVSSVTEHLAYQFNITGEGEGAFYVEVKDGELHVEPYEYYDRDAIFICSAKTLFKLADGKLDPVFAFTTGKLKVEGSLDKALKLKDFVLKAKKRQGKEEMEETAKDQTAEEATAEIEAETVETETTETEAKAAAPETKPEAAETKAASETEK